ncbi:unnamed protein product [Prunus armeniaca]|uniref:Uncharacterized protein n=1 Tax=Prunus armeniaca TaxID=36596 RepID=A0A6J5U1T3_PRUAR|nr:unnamed protein product [Prunus armeniaca]
MMNESTTSVGKKRPRGSKEEQWLCSSSSEPMNQPKQRHIAIDEDQKALHSILNFQMKFQSGSRGVVNRWPAYS